MKRSEIEKLYPNSNPYYLNQILDLIEEQDLLDRFMDIETKTEIEKELVLKSAYDQARKKSHQSNFRQKIAEYIKSNSLPYINDLRGNSNLKQSQTRNYNLACMLKALNIELILKNISFLISGPTSEKFSLNNIEQYQQRHFKSIKKILENTQQSTNQPRYTGHEIDDILNRTLPEHIKTLIKYKAITNMADPLVFASGEMINPVIANKSLENFIADYFFMIRDFVTLTNQDSYQNMNALSSINDKLYQRNNSAFIKYRYNEEQATETDYKNLNSLMVAAQMTLEFLLDNPNLAQDFSSGQVIPYKYISHSLTEAEYKQLLSQATLENYDFNSLLCYHSFLKKYLQERTPKLTDARYARINTLFTAIKDKQNIAETGKVFQEWFNSINILSLSKEEFKELKVIAPEFIYNSLTYKNKLIFRKCQEKGIEYEYYYKIDPSKFEQIVEAYGDDFKGHSIDIKLLIKEPDEVNPILRVLKDFAIPIAEIPSYYYDYTKDEIKKAYSNRMPSQHNRFLTKEELLKARGNIRQQAAITHIEKYCDDKSYDASNLERIKEFIHETCVAEEARKTRLLLLSNLLEQGEIDDNNYAEYRCSEEQFQRLKQMNYLKKKYNLETIEAFLDMGDFNLFLKANGIEIYDAMAIVTKKFRFAKNVSANNANPKFSMSKEKIVLGDNPYVAINQMMNSSVEVTTDMAFLSSDEATKNYSYVSNVYPSAEIKSYLLYKTPEETKEIIALCQQKGIDFYPELLYVEMDILKQNLSQLSHHIKYEKNVHQELEITADTMKNISTFVLEQAPITNKPQDNQTLIFPLSYDFNVYPRGFQKRLNGLPKKEAGSKKELSQMLTINGVEKETPSKMRRAS